MALRVAVDSERCTGHGRCYVLAPETFGEDERGHCLIENEVVTEELKAEVQLAASNCPEHAISVAELLKHEV